MSYALGVDLGTAYTAAATLRDGRVEIASLGSQSATVPSVVLLKEDETILTGDAANRRGIMEPGRVAREFKRRVGDTTPIFLGGAPQSAEALMARLLRWVAAEVAAEQGGPAESLAVCHPANWGRYKIDLLSQAVRIADLGVAKFLTEPEAAAIHYASKSKVEPGEVIAVYDLGGGTFDAAVLRKTEDGFEILGEPEGIERLGGIDFDAAVLAHVARNLGGKLEELDEDDPAAVSAMARLRQDCVDAKEALSSDTDVSIPVLLPNVQTEVRLTRAEFESMIRPSLVDSLGSMRRAIASANIEATQVSTVLLIGGSSRIPLVSQMVGSELARPVAVDTHPKHAVALGAALAAGSAAAATPAPAPTPPVATAAVAPVAPVVETPPEPVAAVAEEPAAPAAAESPSPVPPAAPIAAPAKQEQPASPSRAGEPAPKAAGSGLAKTPTEGNTKLVAAGVAALLVIGIGAFVALSGGGDKADDAAPDTTAAVAEGSTDQASTDNDDTAADVVETTSTAGPTTTVALVDPPSQGEVSAAVLAVSTDSRSSVTAEVSDRTVVLQGLAYDSAARDAIVAAAGLAGITDVVDQLELQGADEQCSEEIRTKQNWACLTGATFDGTTVVGSYVGSPDEGAAAWSVAASLHLHIFGSNVAPSTAGAAGPYSDGTGSWTVWDDPSTFTGSLAGIGSGDTVPEKLCLRVANQIHTLESLESGNCWPITTIDPS